MKTKLLLFVAGLLGTTAMQAQTLPFEGNALPAEGGTYYLYQVETGKWLQNNMDNASYWTTRASVGKFGLDIEVVAEEGGYRLNPKFGHNHSINTPGLGDNPAFYLDTDQPKTIWQITPVAGKTNVYVISSDGEQHYLNVGDDETTMDDFGWNTEWIFVTKEQRLADLETATKTEPKDATWLIGAHDFANQDERYNQWNRQFEEGNNVTGGDGIVHANRAFESWNSKRIIDFSQTITGIPNGTYELTVQGFYRDGREVEIGEKYLNNTEEIRAYYFANDASKPFMSICNSGVTEADDGSYAVSQGGVYIPGNSIGGNALDRASNCFFKGGYLNEPITVVVSDGTLKIGMYKVGSVDDDWTVFDNFRLTYLGNEIDLDEVKANLAQSIKDAEEYTGETTVVLTNALADAKAAQSSSDAATIQRAAVALREALLATKEYYTALANAEAFDGTITDFFTAALETGRAAKDVETLDELKAATQALIDALKAVRDAQDPLKFIAATIPFAQEVGVDGELISNAQAVIEHAESLDAIRDALNQLRVARKIQAADKAADQFAGAEPADGDFYIYNIGLKRFLCGGGDWGAHAYVGFPGVEVTLISGTEYPEEGDSFSGFKIDTHLNNGGESEYLNYGGYMDTPTQSLWEFVPVEGKTNVYVMARANGETNIETGERMLLGYRPGTYGNIDTDMYGIDNPNNQWKLVTRAERDELLATATADKPQDATYKIVSPNFNQREDDSQWVVNSNGQDVGIYERGENRTDFAYQCWNGSEFDLSQNVYDLLPGWYELSVQGYYRDGNHQDQIRAEAAGEERAQDAFLVDMNTDNQVALPNILDEVDKAPGLGNRSDTTWRIQQTDGEGNPQYNEAGDPIMIDDPNGERLYVGEFPMWIREACEYFQNGLYKTKILLEVKGSEMLILVQKFRDKPNDWVVLDNFRLKYFGTTKPTEEQQGIMETVIERPATGKIYNLNGQQVNNTQKGLFIFNGKKVVRK